MEGEATTIHPFTAWPPVDDRPGNSILLRFLFSEKPRPDVLGHGHEPIIVDPLAVD